MFDVFIYKLCTQLILKNDSSMSTEKVSKKLTKKTCHSQLFYK